VNLSVAVIHAQILGSLTPPRVSFFFLSYYIMILNK
jgi:hypothetical protein